MEDVTAPGRRCGRCKQDLPATAFNRRRADHTGLAGRCKVCDSEYKKEHRTKHPERHRDAAAARYLRDREKIRARQHDRYQLPEVRAQHAEHRHKKYWADPEAARARSKAYRDANPDAAKRWKDAEYQRDGEKIRAKMRAVYESDRERIKAAVLAWARANTDSVNLRNHRYRARKAKAAIGIVTPAQLDAKLAYWAGKCWICGGDPNTWDHVKPLNKGGAHMLGNLRPACWSCNSSKSDQWPFPQARRAGR